MKVELIKEFELHGRTLKPGTQILGLNNARCRELIEEGTARPVGATLPEDFPKRKALMAAGYIHPEQVESAIDKELMKITGIGQKTLSDIRNYNTKQTDEEE